jgi:hypothetical protein
MAAQKRKETGDGRWWCRYDEKIQFWPLLKLNLSRPFGMMLTEPIWYVFRPPLCYIADRVRSIFWNVYIGVVYGILYVRPMLSRLPSCDATNLTRLSYSSASSHTPSSSGKNADGPPASQVSHSWGSESETYSPFLGNLSCGNLSRRIV